MGGLVLDEQWVMGECILGQKWVTNVLVVVLSGSRLGQEWVTNVWLVVLKWVRALGE